MTDAMKGTHTPGPWTVTSRKAFDYRIFRDGGDCPTVSSTTSITNARRIVAAVNAVEGIPTEALEDGAVSELLEAAEAVVDSWDLERGDPKHSLGERVAEVLSPLRSAIRKARGETP